MLAIGSLSEAAFGLRQKLIDNIADFRNDISRIKIGHPGTNLKDIEDLNENGLNLFFYHVDYDGYPADGTADNPFYVRLYCLITAVGHETKKGEPDNTEGRDVSKGENELRLIGEVMAVLHEHPIFPLSDSDDREVASLQIVPHSMNLDTLNHIWGTQGSETPYRLSVAYEMSLAPLPFRLPAKSSPLVGDPQMLSWGAMKRDPGAEHEGVVGLKPQVEYLEIDTSADDWMPHIAFVDDATQTLHYVFKIETSRDVVDILIAGREGERIQFYWSVWRRKSDNSIEAWREDIEGELAIIENDGSGNPFFPDRIDPDSIDSRRVFQVTLPEGIAPSVDTKAWQATLYAVREWQHEEPAGSGMLVITKIRSNSILFYGEST